MTTPLLKLHDVHAFYGKSHILHGVELEVRRGEIVSLLGRNGVGRSTTVKAAIGLVEASGTILFKGENILGLAAYQIAQRGLAYVPENREIFPGLTVRQNLVLGQKPGRKQRSGELAWTLDDMFALFPRLAERADTQAGVLSGGEQQMLTLCRSLMGNPELIMIDEPTEGLAPKIVEQVAAFLTSLKARGVAVLLVEQKLAIALDISERVYVMGHGSIVFEGSPAELRMEQRIRKEWLEI